MWTLLPFLLLPPWVPALALQAGRDGPELASFDVPSQDGRYAARIAKVAGQERVPDALARWELSVVDIARGEALWSTAYPHQTEAARYFTAPDGSSFVRLNERFTDGRPVVRIDRLGGGVDELAGREFELERDDLVRTNEGSFWLTEEGDTAELGWEETAHGPALVLELASARGWRRELDVSMGLVPPPFEFGEVAIVPGFPAGTLPSERLELPWIDRVQVPPVALATLPFTIHVAGRHATPNWRFFAFQLALEAAEGDAGGEGALQRFVLTPYSQPPASGSLVPQVLEGFGVDAHLRGLAPGRYELAVAGRGDRTAAIPFELLPGRTFIRLVTTGGIAGVRDTTEVFQPGIVRQRFSHGRANDGPRTLDPSERDRLRRLAAALPEEPRSGTSILGSDFLQYRLGWWTGAEWREVTVDDGTAGGVVKELIELLRRL